MIVRQLFPNVFKRFQSLLALNQKIQYVLNTTNSMGMQDKIHDLYSVSNIISQQISELQKPFIQQFFRQFPIKDQKLKSLELKKNLNEFFFDQNSFKFVLKSNYQIQLIQKQIPYINDLNQIHEKSENSQQKKFGQMKVTILVNGCPNQKIDSPLKRKSLYFHELKDIDKYVIVQKNAGVPPFIKQLNKKKLQYQVLDKKNPLGVPISMPPLFIQIFLQNKVYFKVKYYLGQILLIQVRKLKKRFHQKNFLVQYQKSKQKVSGMRIPRAAQETIFKNLFQNILEIDRQKMYNYHKLAYVAGRIKKLELMIDMHQMMWSQLQIIQSRNK